MQSRFDYMTVAPGTYRAMGGLERYLADCAIEPMLIHLVKLRASQLNGCAYCLDMHWKDLRAGGESEQRLYSLDAWRECPYYSARERAALAWTEAVTLIADGQAPDAVYDEVRAHFDDKALADLTLAIATINAWNRLAIAARVPPGTYTPAQRPAPDVDQLAADVPPAAGRDPGISPAIAWNRCSADTGFTRCRSKPASPVRCRSCGCPQPVSATSVATGPHGRRRISRAVS